MQQAQRSQPKRTFGVVILVLVLLGACGAPEQTADGPTPAATHAPTRTPRRTTTTTRAPTRTPRRTTTTTTAPKPTRTRTSRRTPSPIPTTAQTQAQADDQGDFKVSYERVTNKDYRAFQKELQDERVLETLADELNSALRLPVDITLSFAECDEENAFYDPDEHQISLCYELIESFYTLFENEVPSKELDDAVVGATEFILFHELGHALIDVYHLPTTGKEEDAVDQFSTFLLTDGSDDGEQSALFGAQSFLLAAQQAQADVDALAFWDEHSLDEQRFYNIVCLVYGQNPKKYKYLVKEDTLPEDRAKQCEGEYAQVERAWGTLLTPYVKDE